jgi:pyruvate/2-oxoglutarate dehydrogenase complex dihydrolipoamide dehydrogenase (E3) component
MSRKIPELLPDDEHNRALLANVHPADWANPEPAPRYNLVVIGAGTAGLITAAVASGLGAKVALVERHMMGGDCLNVGCVPSKGMIRASRVVGEVRRAETFGIHVPGDPQVDFGAVMSRMREVRRRISHEDSVRRYSEELGVDVFLGEARFVGSDLVEVDGRKLRFSKAVIATGARAAAPPIEGLEEAGYLTNETVFSLTERPRRLGVIGGGPIGSELSQAFRLLGSEVTLFEKAPRILGREDLDAAAIVQDAFVREGIRLELGASLQRVEKGPEGKVLHYEVAGVSRRAAVDEILVGAGRAPNVEGLNLEAVGVSYDTRAGVAVDDTLRTTNPRIFAAGDVCLSTKFTHAADATAKIVVRNALFPFGRQKVSDLVIPWCTYTDPEVAHVGLYEHEASEKGIEIDTFKVPLEKLNRALADGEEEGFFKVHVKRGTDRILGATIVASHAGEMINEYTLAIGKKLGLGTIAGVIHPYPTQAEGIKATANAYMRTRLTPRVAKLFAFWLRRTR